ncbi:PDDEXK nuclease domain-containing protein [Mesotoga sp. UBA5847]|jgi:predicted nuclease of restriction endonuclease-like (RecB) superfamily|uniref:PDDEXK nuclease domain-containing protein n=1 Tax=Mesotoga sp. UBA5847 TaxID=1946859 RepID=UPI0025D34F2D|nr:PDDEXK nuclease domain-containing protein [Mesotoga sp. UBA5847]
MANNQEGFNFSTLVTAIHQVDENMAAQASRAVNVSLTLRNWMIGAYIDKYELNGSDRADYGDKLLSELAKRLTGINVSNCNRRQLYRYLRFYRLYPQIVGTLSAQLKTMLPADLHGIEKVGTPSPQLKIPPEKLVYRLSYSHLELIVDLDDPLKRTFYEIECIRGNWSVRELKRQIGSLYYERSGLSENKEKLAELVQSGTEKSEPKLAVRDPYVFEFLGIKSCEVMRESDLEDQLLNKLQDFLLELGHGFCFEARQKRILIGDTHGFVDLVFYHRILKCHVLVELKVESFNHENLGQLNTYVSWYRKNMMADGDKPPVGILLCTQKDHALVEYALAGMDNHLFVSKYQLELPRKEEIQKFLEEKMREVGE